MRDKLNVSRGEINGNILYQKIIESANSDKDAWNFRRQHSLIIRGIHSIISSFFSTIECKLLCEFKSLVQNFITLKEYMRHRRHKRNISESFVPKWRKVGIVKDLFMYPLVAGGATENVMSCYIHHNEIIGCKDGVPTRNHMFVVYNEKTKIIETNGEMYNFTKMRISVKDENTMIMKGVNVESVPLVLKDFMTGTDRKTCMTSFAREFLVKVEVSDCGQVAAEWLKSYTKNRSLRLGYILRDFKPQKTFMYQYHKLSSENKDHRNIMIPFEDIPCFTLLSNISFNEIKKTLPRALPQMLRPNIFISTTSEKLFDEVKWQQIKIGNAICNNVKPWNRLESQINLTNMPIDIKLEKILLHCEVLCPGPVRKGDNVYVLDEEDN